MLRRNLWLTHRRRCDRRSQSRQITHMVDLGLAFCLVALYVAVRMGVFALSVEAIISQGAARLPNTFASVDHPFHVARAEIVWRELASGNVVRWIGQHQGGYPVEFYPLGEA